MPHDASRMCECEENAHFQTEVRTPNGNPGHDYGQRFAYYFVRKVTAYGHTLTVCLDCASDCLGSHK